LLVFAEAGRDAPPEDDAARDAAQARVVAAADELARELHEKLRLGDGDGGVDDGYNARTQAMRTADARTGADAVARARDAAKAPRKRNDREWNETFTNMPLSAVVPGEQPLQGTQGARPGPREAPRGRPRASVPLPSPPRAAGPTGTAVADSLADAPPVDDRADEPATSPFLSFVLTALAVTVIGAIGLGIMEFVKDDPPASTTAGPAAPGGDFARAKDAEREAELQRAVDGMRVAYQQGEWAKASAYASAALQLQPDDAMARRYLQDADEKQKAAAGVAAGAASATSGAQAEPAPPGAAPSEPATAATATPAAATTPPAMPSSASPLPAPPAPVASAPAPAPQAPSASPLRPKKTPTPSPSSPPRRGMSEDEAKTLFDQAITAFKNKETEDGCKLLDRIVDRAPSSSLWHEKAAKLFGRRCGE